MSGGSGARTAAPPHVCSSHALHSLSTDRRSCRSARAAPAAAPPSPPLRPTQPQHSATHLRSSHATTPSPSYSLFPPRALAAAALRPCVRMPLPQLPGPAHTVLSNSTACRASHPHSARAHSRTRTHSVAPFMGRCHALAASRRLLSAGCLRSSGDKLSCLRIAARPARGRRSPRDTGGRP